MAELLVFYTEGDEGQITQGLAALDGDGLPEALDALLEECGDAEVGGGIDIHRFGPYYGRPCAEVTWNDEGPLLRVFDIAGRSHALMIDGRSLADILAEAVLAYNEENTDVNQ